MIFVANQSTVEAESYPLTHARIGWKRISGTVSASTSTAGFPAIAANSVNTYESWKPTAMPATWAIDAGETVDADYCAIAVHELAGCTINVEHSENGSSWTAIFNTPRTVLNGDPVLILFPSTQARYWRIAIAGPRTPSIAHIRFGEVLAMERPIFAGHSPGPLSRETVLGSNASERGQFLGRSVIRSGVAEDFAWSHLSPAWYRSRFDPFVRDMRINPFFIAWRPNPGSQSANDVIYGWTNDDVKPSNMGIRDLMQVSIGVAGVSNYE